MLEADDGDSCITAHVWWHLCDVIIQNIILFRKLGCTTKQFWMAVFYRHRIISLIKTTLFIRPFVLQFGQIYLFFSFDEVQIRTVNEVNIEEKQQYWCISTIKTSAFFSETSLFPSNMIIHWFSGRICNQLRSCWLDLQCIFLKSWFLFYLKFQNNSENIHQFSKQMHFFLIQETGSLPHPFYTK